jgi:hypothetical protein
MSLQVPGIFASVVLSSRCQGLLAARCAHAIKRARWEYSQAEEKLASAVSKPLRHRFGSSTGPARLFSPELAHRMTVVSTYDRLASEKGM